MFKKINKLVRKHKVCSGIGIVFVLVLVYFGYRTFGGAPTPTRYVLARVEQGAIAVTVSGSGQVSASNQVDIKTKVSGEALTVPVVAGRYVNAGAIITELDSRDAQKTVRDAELSLQNAQLAFAKVKGPDGAPVPRNKEQAAADLARAYDDGFTTVADAFIDLPSLVTDFGHLLTDKTLDRTQENLSWYANQVSLSEETARAAADTYRDTTQVDYTAAKSAFDVAFSAYKAVSRASQTAMVETIILQTYNTAKTIADAVKAMNNYIDFVKDFMEGKNYSIPSGVTTEQSSLNTFMGTLNGHVAKLLAASTAIKNAKDSYDNADIDLASQALSVKERENALADAKEKLADYTVCAPFGGIIAKLNVKKGDEVSSGTVAATIITTRKVAEISLNEVDVAHVALGQKAKLSFDAVPDTKVDGVVSEVDTVGTMSQGVVSYTVKVAFNLADARVKPGMSVTADIVTQTADHALMIPNSAVKTAGNKSFVQLVPTSEVPAGSLRNPTGFLLPTLPQRTPVELGLSNDTVTQILSGLNEGDIVVARAIDAAAQAAAPASASTQNNTAFRIPGLGGGGRGNFGR